jgi:hypothetical protein
MSSIPSVQSLLPVASSFQDGFIIKYVKPDMMSPIGMPSVQSLLDTSLYIPIVVSFQNGFIIKYVLKEEDLQDLRAKLRRIMNENGVDEIDDDTDDDEEFEEKDYDSSCEQCLGQYSSKSKYVCQNGDGLNFCCENCMEEYEDDSDEEESDSDEEDDPVSVLDTPFN